MLLIQKPGHLGAESRATRTRYLEPFIEEVLRLESPVQCLLRETSVDVELHGVTIPGWSNRQHPVRPPLIAMTVASSSPPGL